MANKEVPDNDSAGLLLNIKSTKEKLEIRIASSKNVKELKEIIRQRLGDDLKGELCLIFSGKILKDEDTLESHGIVKDGLTLHLVLRGPKTTPTTSNASSATTTSSTSQGSSSSTGTTSSGSSNSGSGAAPPQFNPFGMMGGVPPPAGDMQAQMQQLFNNPEMMQQILESPMMQNLMANPDAFQSLFTSNPQIQQLMERNPELSHILNNPDLMRQALEMARNPGAMREMMRSQDRQLSNIESLPGGFNALARMYSEIQEPMMDAAQESLQQQVQNNPFAALFSGPQQNPSSQSGPSAPQGTANTAPLPNPWGSSNQSSGNSSTSTSSGSTQRSTSTSTSTTSTTSGSGAGGGGFNLAEMMRVMSENPNMLSQMDGGPFQANSNPLQMLQDPAHRQMYQQMMQNPEARQAMMDLMSNPQALQSMMQMFPGMQNMLAGQDLNQLTAQTAQMMNNPQTMEMLSNPEAMQGYLNMMQGYNQLMQSMPGASSLLNPQVPPSSTSQSSSTTGSNNEGSGSGGGGSGGVSPSTPPNNAAMLQMMQQMMGQGAANPMGGVGSGGASQVPSGGGQPAETQEQAAARRYRVQIETLEGMGFPDRAANIQALIDCGGDLNAAIDKLIKY